MAPAMRDKLTRKRVKVDYLLVIKLSDKEESFLLWLKKHNSKLSFNRLAYAFCKHESIDVDSIYSACLERGLHSYDDYLKECCRLAQDHSWLED